MVNQVTLIGRLGADPEVRRLESGVAVARLRMATNESYKDKNGEWQDITEWHTVILWRGAAERAENQLKKGNLIYVQGKLTTRKWQDKDGNDRYNTEVSGNIFRLLERKEQQGGGNYFPTEEPPNVNTKTETTETATPVVEDNSDAIADDLPF